MTGVLDDCNGVHTRSLMFTSEASEEHDRAENQVDFNVLQGSALRLSRYDCDIEVTAELCFESSTNRSIITAT